MKHIVITIGVLMLMVMLILMVVNGIVASSTLPIYGDANGDHSVNMADITTIELMLN